MEAAAVSVADGAGLEAPPARRGRRFAVIARRAAGVGLGAALLAFGLSRYRAASRAPAAHYETVAIDEGALDAKVTATGAVSAAHLRAGGQPGLGAHRAAVRRFRVVGEARPDHRDHRAVAVSRRGGPGPGELGGRPRWRREGARSEAAGRSPVRAKSRRSSGQGLVSRADSDVADSAAAVAVSEVASAEASVAQARAALDQAELNLKYTTIVSPIDGSRDLAQRRRRPDRGGGAAGADALHDRPGPDQDAGRHQRRRGRRRQDSARA